MFNSSKFSFEKINNLYLYLGLSGIGLAGLSKGIGKLNQKAFDKTFKWFFMIFVFLQINFNFFNVINFW